MHVTCKRNVTHSVRAKCADENFVICTDSNSAYFVCLARTCALNFYFFAVISPGCCFRVEKREDRSKQQQTTGVGKNNRSLC